jgi:hypothetical protein
MIQKILNGKITVAEAVAMNKESKTALHDIPWK